MSTGDELDPGAKRLWPLIREQVAVTSAAGQDDRRLRGVLARRRAKSQEFFASAAGDWDRLRSDLFGDTFYLWGVLGLIDPALVVGDLGCGTGQLTEVVARMCGRWLPSTARRTCSTRRVFASAARPTSICGRVNWRACRSRRESLTRHALAGPALLAVTGTRARGSRARSSGGGRVLVVDMLPHERQEYQQQMGHVWLGFSEKQIGKFLTDAGFSDVRTRCCRLIPCQRAPRCLRRQGVAGFGNAKCKIQNANVRAACIVCILHFAF